MIIVLKWLEISSTFAVLQIYVNLLFLTNSFCLDFKKVVIDVAIDVAMNILKC